MIKPTPTTRPARSSKNRVPICIYLRPLIMMEGKGGGRLGRASASKVGGWTES